MSSSVISPPAWNDYSDPRMTKLIERAKQEQVVYVDASYLLPARRFLIKTTDLAVRYYKFMCDNQTRARLQDIYRECYEGLLKWKVEDAAEENKQAEWNDYCNEILAVYVMRNLLHGKPIPARLRSAVSGNELRR